jgi:hypothetical protein
MASALRMAWLTRHAGVSRDVVEAHLIGVELAHREALDAEFRDGLALIEDETVDAQLRRAAGR